MLSYGKNNGIQNIFRILPLFGPYWENPVKIRPQICTFSLGPFGVMRPKNRPVGKWQPRHCHMSGWSAPIGLHGQSTTRGGGGCDYFPYFLPPPSPTGYMSTEHIWGRGEIGEVYLPSHLERIVHNNQSWTKNFTS
jgi:hypothetical protein